MKWTLRLLIFLCLFWGVRGVGIAWTTFAEHDLYQAVDAAGSWFLRVSVNGAFGIAFLAVAWGLFRRWQWGYKACLPLLVLVMLFDFLWMAAYAQAEFDRGRLGFIAATSLAGMGLSLWLWIRLRKLSWSH